MISVIVPIYNVEPYLYECLDSILNQTYHDLEVLLIDDGSTDRCGKICDEYAKNDTRIRVFHTENYGLSAARNLGLRKAKGEYIGFVDSDDWLEPDMYDYLLRRLEGTGSDISACGVWREFRNSRDCYSIDDAVYHRSDAIKALIIKQTNGVWNKLYRKACWSGISFPEKHTYEEISTTYKVFLNADSLSCVSKPLYHYRLREGSIVYTQTKNNLMDYWNAHYSRFSFLSTLPEFKNDHEVIEHLESQIAKATVKTLSWTYKIPQKQRDYLFLQTVSNFVQNRFSLFGRKNWKLYLRIGIFFCRNINDVSLAVLYVPACIYSFLNSLKNEPFPSCPPQNSLRKVHYD